MADELTIAAAQAHAKQQEVNMWDRKERDAFIVVAKAAFGFDLESGNNTNVTLRRLGSQHTYRISFQDGGNVWGEVIAPNGTVVDRDRLGGGCRDWVDFCVDMEDDES